MGVRVLEFWVHGFRVRGFRAHIGNLYPIFKKLRKSPTYFPRPMSYARLTQIHAPGALRTYSASKLRKFNMVLNVHGPLHEILDISGWGAIW